MNQAEPIQILLVEDDYADQKLTRISLKQSKVANVLHVVNNGEEALDFLYQSKEHNPQTPKPDLVLLDLNMPGIGGTEVLRIIKEDDALKTIPVIILTTSDAEEDILKTYQLHVNGYVKKPLDIEGFHRVVQSIEDFWFIIAKLPPKNRGI